MKICVVGDVLDVITCAKFQYEIFRVYDFIGVEVSIFLLILNAPSTVQRYCAACDLRVKLCYEISVQF